MFNNNRTMFFFGLLWMIHIYPTGTQYSDPVSTLLRFIGEGMSQFDDEPPDRDKLLKEYDFIIVGAGTAGCVLANRLTEINNWKVLLIEAGMNENFLMDVPILANYLQATPANWKYKTKPSDKYCTGFENKQCNWPRGKVMGGSSVLNYMIYTRGASYDYENWKNMGNVGWGWEDVLPYFKKIENFNIDSSTANDKYHAHDGYLNIEYAPYRTLKAKEWVKASQELGFKYNDINGEKPSGVSFLQLSMKNGTRHSSSRAYLHPAGKRKNLHVTKLSLVTKLLFDKTNENVIGLEMEKRGKQLRILVKKEVILSAGAINSPQLLMLSGIGPKDHLNSLKIPIVKDLPVGHNLMDHMAAGGIQFYVQPQNLKISPDYLITRLDLIFKWMRNHSGPLAIPGGIEALLFMNLADKYNMTGWPDMELLFITGGLNIDATVPANFGFDKKLYSEIYSDLADKDTLMILPMLMRPKSKGRVMLQSSNPKSHPILIPNYFEYPEDLQKIVEGIKVAIEIARQPSMLKLGAKFYDVPIPDCLKYGPFGSDEYFACQAQMFTLTIYHQSGTCKMGSAQDSSAVVDARLRVHGISNLRVIDASIMPEIVSGHTNAPTFMIAEKGSDMIKEDWNVTKSR